MIKLYHYTKKENLKSILRQGLTPESRYESLSPLRENVVYCWLSPDDQKIFHSDEVCLEIEVCEDRCIVAEMDYISLAQMYQYGGAKRGGKDLPQNPEAAELLVKLYEVTSAPIQKTKREHFFSPEVLVKGKVEPDRIKVYA